MTADGDVLSIPIPRERRGVIRHFQEQMPHGLRMLLSARCLGHSPKFKQLAINKPFECRSAVVLSPSFRQMREGYICCSAGPPSMRQRGKPLVRNWRKHGNPRYYRRTAQQRQLC